MQRLIQEEQVVQASGTREKGPKESAERQDSRGTHGRAHWQAETAAHCRRPVPALARSAHGDAQPGEPVLHQVSLALIA